jgi:hypothetical protein
VVIRDLSRLDDDPGLGPVPWHDLRIQIAPGNFFHGNGAVRVRNERRHRYAELGSPTHSCGCPSSRLPGSSARLEVASWQGLAKQRANRDDEGMEGPKNEREFYRRIISRAKTVRERAAVSLRQSRVLRKGQGDARGQPDAAPKRRRFRRPD